MKFVAHGTEPGSIESDYSLNRYTTIPIMSEVPLLFNGDPFSKFEAQTDLELAARYAAAEMIGLPGLEIDDVLAVQRLTSLRGITASRECRSYSAEKERIPDAHRFSNKNLLVRLETFDR